MSNQPEALRLANSLAAHSLSRHGQTQAAAELRRLQALLEAEQALHQRVTYPELQRLRAQRDALLEALRTLLSYANVLEMRLLDADGEHRAMQKARAAIAKAVEEQK